MTTKTKHTRQTREAALEIILGASTCLGAAPDQMASKCLHALAILRDEADYTLSLNPDGTRTVSIDPKGNGWFFNWTTR